MAIPARLQVPGPLMLSTDAMFTTTQQCGACLAQLAVQVNVGDHYSLPVLTCVLHKYCKESYA